MAYKQITRAQLRTLAFEQLGALGGVFWRVDEVNRLIQESLRVWNALTGYWRTRAVVNAPTGTVANQVWYTLPSTLTSQMRLEFNGLPMEPTSLWDLDYGRPAWEQETTTSGGAVPTTPKMWAPAGLTLIAIWPADAVGGNSLTADGVAQTPVLTLDTDFIDIGYEELNLLMDYIQHIASLKEGGQEFQATQGNLQSFLKGAAATNGKLMASARYRQWMGLNNTEEKKPHRLRERVGAR